MQNRVAIITARGGSKRIPGKNIRPFCGKPIIQYSIFAALETNLFSEVMVSTNDDEIAKIALSLGAKVPFMRSEKTSNDFAGTADVINEVINEYKTKKLDFAVGCCIYPTAPLINKDILTESFKVFEEMNFNVVFPVTAFSYPIQRGLKFSEELHSVSMLWPENYSKRSQDLEKVYHDAGQFYWFKSEFIETNNRLFGTNVGGYKLKELYVQDIDNEEDWQLAEIKYEAIQKLSSH